jgi:hypothetical protein
MEATIIVTLVITAHFSVIPRDMSQSFSIILIVSSMSGFYGVQFTKKNQALPAEYIRGLAVVIFVPLLVQYLTS